MLLWKHSLEKLPCSNLQFFVVFGKNRTKFERRCSHKIFLIKKRVHSFHHENNLLEHWSSKSLKINEKTKNNSKFLFRTKNIWDLDLIFCQFINTNLRKKLRRYSLNLATIELQPSSFDCFVYKRMHIKYYHTEKKIDRRYEILFENPSFSFGDRKYNEKCKILWFFKEIISEYSLHLWNPTLISISVSFHRISVKSFITLP